jgi:hypothetical protein
MNLIHNPVDHLMPLAMPASGGFPVRTSRGAGMPGISG